MKNRILEGATKLFFRFGVKSITMDTIASDLGISKKTIYQHFPDKDSLVKEVMIAFLEKDRCLWKQLEENYPDVIAKMFHSFEVMKDMLTEINPRLMYEVEKYHPDAFAIFRSYENEVMLSYLIKDLNSGIQEGYFRPEIPVELIAKLRMAEIQMLFNPSFFESYKKSVFEMHLEFMDYFLRGIMTPKGLSVYNEYLNVKTK
jgi:AcrR family transcriptional regulator